MPPPSYVIGIDLGGTAAKLGLVKIVSFEEQSEAPPPPSPTPTTADTHTHTHNHTPPDADDPLLAHSLRLPLPSDPAERTPDCIVSLLAEGCHRLLLWHPQTHTHPPTSTQENNRETGVPIPIPWTEIKAIGVGFPGIVRDHALAVGAANLCPGWKDVPLVSMLREKLFGLGAVGGGAAGAGAAAAHPPPPIFLLNDADAALAAEVWCGAARGKKNVVMLTLGTGVGTAVMLDGKPWVGARGLVEAGHMIIEKDGRLCGCGQRGCLEMYTSATAVVRRANEVGLRTKKMEAEGEEEGRRIHAVSGESDALNGESDGGAAITNAKQVFDAAFPPLLSSSPSACIDKADPLALQVIEELTEYLSLGCVNICRMLDPDLLLFAGGMSGAPDVFWVKLKKTFAKYGWTILPHEIEMSVAALGGDRAGVLGAAWAAWRGVG